MHVTFFSDYKAKKISIADLSLKQLKELILSTSAPSKKDLPWLKLAKFGDKKSPNGSYRYNANVTSISGAELDYDGKKFSMEEAIKILERNKIKSLVYTSPTNSYSCSKWRVLAPTSKDLPPELRTLMVARINGMFRGIFARESFVLSQAYYYGKVEGNSWHRAEAIDGDFIDLRQDLDVSAAIPMHSTRQKRKSKSEEKVDPRLVQMAMEVIPNYDLSWPEWNRIGMALWSALDGEHFEIFDEWSKKSDKYNARETQDRWNTYFKCPPTDLGIGTIIYIANGAHPWWQSAYHNEVMMVDRFLHLGVEVQCL